MRLLSWLVGAVVILLVLWAIVTRPLPLGIEASAPFADLVIRGLHVLAVAFALCLYRVAAGPTAPDRIVAVDILGVLIVGFCALLSVVSGHSWYLDIGIAWALQSFIGALALSKHLEGRPFDE